jgi:cysteine desulfurase
LKALEAKGCCDVTFLSPGKTGAVDVEALQAAIRDDTCLVTIMAVNNETGVMSDIERIADISQERDIPLVVDGVALLGKEEFSIPSGISAMFFSGHKFHAPKGIGMAFIRGDWHISPLLTGGGQEYGLRSGTENIPGIVGMASAINLLSNILPAASEHMRTLRDYFEDSLKNNLQDIVINGSGQRICNTSNMAFLGVDAESLLMSLDMEGIAVSHGSACSSGALEPSRILLNMGIDPMVAQSSLRFSLSRMTTREDIDYALDKIIRMVIRLRR